MHLGYLGPNPVSLFFLRRGKCDKWLLLAFPHWGYGSICWIAVLGVPAPPTPFNIWRPEIADGCDISCLLIWQEMFSFYPYSLPGSSVHGIFQARTLERVAISSSIQSAYAYITPTAQNVFLPSSLHPNTNISRPTECLSCL